MLTENAVDEQRFQDAGYYYWLLSRQYLNIASDGFVYFYYIFVISLTKLFYFNKIFIIFHLYSCTFTVAKILIKCWVNFTYMINMLQFIMHIM